MGCALEGRDTGVEANGVVAHIGPMNRLAIVGAVLLIAVVACADGPLFRMHRATGLPHRTSTFGGTLADLDGDGRRDLIMSLHGDEDAAFYRNHGDLTFSALELASRPTGLRDHHGTAACDDDGDGIWDLFLTAGADRGRGGSSKQLWRHDGHLGFTSPCGCEHLLVDPDGRGRGALWLQLSPAELPSLLLLNFWSPPRLFGREEGRWVDRTGWLRALPAGVAPEVGDSWIVGVTADLDGDRAPDLVSMGVGWGVWRNVEGRLELVTETGVPADGPQVADAAAGDVDGDGDHDLVLVLQGGQVHVLLNESSPGTIRFTGPVVANQPLSIHEPVSCALADLDNDGHLDLAVARRSSDSIAKPVLMRGTGDGTFLPVSSPRAGLAGVASRAMAIWAEDLDLDGDLDLLAINGEELEKHQEGAVVIYENLTTLRGLTLELVPVADGPPHALGAEVALEAGDVRQVRQVRSVANPWNSTVAPVHFGVDDELGPLTVTVTWPSGRRQTQVVPFSGVDYRLTEGRDELVPLPLRP
jgi:hypothetical protein